MKLAYETELAPVSPRDRAPIIVGRRPEERFVDEHPVHRSTVAWLLGRQEEYTSRRVRIEKGVGWSRNISIRCTVLPETHHCISPDRWQLVFTLDEDLAHVGDVVEVEGHLVVDFPDSKKEVRVEKDDVLFFEPLKFLSVLRAQ